MKTRIQLMLFVIAVSVFAMTGCEKSPLVGGNTKDGAWEKMSKDGLQPGANSFSGVGYYDDIDMCDAVSVGATFSVKMTGDLQGCLYIFIEDYACNNGNYFEKGTELFVGTYKGESGSFRTTYNFHAKFEGCNPDGTYAGAEIAGQCQHPIVAGSGTGVFTGVTGRFNMRDQVKADPINYPYAGHFSF